MFDDSPDLLAVRTHVDPGVLDHLAAQVAARAHDVRHCAAALLHRLTAVDWSGIAADAFHVHAHAILAGLRHVAERLDDAAAALRRHAAAVSAAVAALQRISHAGTDLAGSLAGGLAGGLGADLDGLTASLEGSAPGSLLGAAPGSLLGAVRGLLP